MNNIKNPFADLTLFERGLWGISVAVIVLSAAIMGGADLFSVTASLIGVTALIFVAKGDVTGQILTVIFSILYAIVSFEQRYYGEMITYLFMSAPSAIFSVISWLRHPFATDHAEVKMERIGKKDLVLLPVLCVLVTAAFYWILRWMGNAQLGVSTFSIATSFLASYLLFRRSPFYALAYVGNDVVLILLWTVAAFHDPTALSMIACFVMFLCNDLYGFFNWIRLRRAQARYEKGL